MSIMFANAQFNQPLDKWNVDNVTDMSSMFVSNRNFNQPINDWKVNNVTDMSDMFGGVGSLKSFNQPLDQWIVSNVTTMRGMFRSSAFNQPINNWDVSAVTDMRDMFGGWSTIYSTFDQPLDDWIVTNVTTMEGMFQSSSFDQDIGAWDVSNVTSMRGMFTRAQRFNQTLAGWSTDEVTNMSNMFSFTPVFNQSLNSWDKDNVSNMSTMFSEADAFDQNLAGWNITNVTDMTNMLSRSGLSQENYDNTLIGWAAQAVSDNVRLGANTLQYCDGLSARQDLIDNHGWRFSGDAVNCSNVFCTSIVNPAAGDTNVPANSNIRWAATPNATGYNISLELERNGTRSFVNINGNPADDLDIGNIQIINFTNEFDPGDTVYITVVPYNDEGPAVGCEEFSFTTVASWVNNPASYKIQIDTRINGFATTPANQFEMEKK